MAAKRTTITVSPELREKIRQRQHGRDTPSDVILGLIERDDLQHPKSPPRAAPERPQEVPA